MLLEMETKAAKLLLRVLLSCQCPINKNDEEKIIQYYLSQRDKPSLDLQRIIDIVGESNGYTVFHRLRDSCFEYKDNLSAPTITQEDIYRHFCGICHWEFVNISLAYHENIKNTPISNIPAWSVGHMLLPVKLRQENNLAFAEYSGPDYKIELSNIFVPPDFEIKTDAVYAIHFASLITEITDAQAEIINQELDNIPKFTEFRKKLKSIDYANFQGFGNYRKICENRYSRYAKQHFK
jgi:hypothetical protein